jgi:hypothetical protein
MIAKPKNQYPAYAANHGDDGKPTSNNPTDPRLTRADREKSKHLNPGTIY